MKCMCRIISQYCSQTDAKKGKNQGSLKIFHLISAWFDLICNKTLAKNITNKKRNNEIN